MVGMYAVVYVENMCVWWMSDVHNYIDTGYICMHNYNQYNVAFFCTIVTL